MMTMTRMMTLVLLTVFASGPLARAQAAASAPPTYVNENTTDPAPLKIRDVDGVVRGLGGDAMSRVSVALFTEEGHALVASAMSDRDGKFRFEKVEKGRYRLVARIAGLCPANIPILVESSLLAHRRVVITMQPKDIDLSLINI